MSLEIETSRFTPIYDKTFKKDRHRLPPVRLRKLCNMGVCEDEVHFITICTKYEAIGKTILDSILKYETWCLSMKIKICSINVCYFGNTPVFYMESLSKKYHVIY